MLAFSSKGKVFLINLWITKITLQTQESRSWFNFCVQAESESIAEYSARLRRLATDCNFGTLLPRALRDQFLSGIRDGNTKKKLLCQDISTLQDIMKTAIADEAKKREN